MSDSTDPWERVLVFLMICGWRLSPITRSIVCPLTCVGKVTYWYRPNSSNRLFKAFALTSFSVSMCTLKSPRHTSLEEDSQTVCCKILLKSDIKWVKFKEGGLYIVTRSIHALLWHLTLNFITSQEPYMSHEICFTFNSWRYITASPPPRPDVLGTLMIEKPLGVDSFKANKSFW